MHVPHEIEENDCLLKHMSQPIYSNTDKKRVELKERACQGQFARLSLTALVYHRCLKNTRKFGLSTELIM